MQNFEDPSSFNRQNLTRIWTEEETGRRHRIERKASLETRQKEAQVLMAKEEKRVAKARFEAELLSRRAEAKERRAAIRNAELIHKDQARQKSQSSDEWVLAKAMHQIAKEEP